MSSRGAWRSRLVFCGVSKNPQHPPANPLSAPCSRSTIGSARSRASRALGLSPNRTCMTPRSSSAAPASLLSVPNSRSFCVKIASNPFTSPEKLRRKQLAEASEQTRVRASPEHDLHKLLGTRNIVDQLCDHCGSAWRII